MLGFTNMKSTRRPYRLQARADSSDATRRRILDAAVDALERRRASEIRLEDVATAAGVTVQTVLRIFGRKSDLLSCASTEFRDRILAQRESATPGDIGGTIAALFDHYEDMGDFVIRNLADEEAQPDLQVWLAMGRQAHRESVERQFAPQLARRTDHDLVLEALVVACDVYTWKLLRRDAGKGRDDAEASVRFMVRRLLEVG
jgi:AcrR family transcriptional regulator